MVWKRIMAILCAGDRVLYPVTGVRVAEAVTKFAVPIALPDH